MNWGHVDFQSTALPTELKRQIYLLRIDYVLKELKENKKLRSYTIQAIAEEIGFKKAESFSKAFKKRTGLNPSFYIKQIKKLDEN